MALRVTKEAYYTIMPVSVVPLGSGRAHAPVDLNTNDENTELDVHAKNTAHFAAVGATVHAAAGQTVPVTVGMRSYGTAYIYDRSGGEGVGQIEAVFPQGTTVVKVLQNCGFVPQTSWNPQPSHYDCNIPWLVAPGFQDLNTFSLRVDKGVPAARGQVWLGNMLSDTAGKPVSYPWDPSNVGHTDAIVLNP